MREAHRLFTYEGYGVTNYTWVQQGGWSPEWLSKEDLETAKKRWAAKGEAIFCETIDGKEWGPFQCGGCKFFVALDSDFGICCNPQSMNDGSILGEHSGCREHSEIQPIKGEVTKYVHQWERTRNTSVS